MRQAGVLAAAGLIALEEMPERLAEDHAKASWLASALAGIAGIKISPEKVRTNIVIFDISQTKMDSTAFIRRLREQSVIASAVNQSLVRLVTHFDVSRSDCEAAVEAVRQLCRR
jgi:threonine aldolase